VMIYALDLKSRLKVAWLDSTTYLQRQTRSMASYMTAQTV